MSHINAYCGVLCCSVAGYWGAESKGLGLDSSRGLKIFPSSHDFSTLCSFLLFPNLNFKILIINFHKFALSCRYLQELREWSPFRSLFPGTIWRTTASQANFSLTRLLRSVGLFCFFLPWQSNWPIRANDGNNLNQWNEAKYCTWIALGNTIDWIMLGEHLIGCWHDARSWSALA